MNLKFLAPLLVAFNYDVTSAGAFTGAFFTEPYQNLAPENIVSHVQYDSSELQFIGDTVVAAIDGNFNRRQHCLLIPVKNFLAKFSSVNPPYTYCKQGISLMALSDEVIQRMPVLAT